MKPSIDAQISAVKLAMVECPQGLLNAKGADLDAALATLRWVKRHAPLIKTILQEFPGSTVNPREEE